MSNTSREMEVAQGHYRFHTVVLSLLIFMTGVCLCSHAAELEYSPQTKPAPLKGLITYPSGNSTMEWCYLSLRNVTKEAYQFDWKLFEKHLDQNAAAGRQVIVRPILERNSEYTGIPDYLIHTDGAITMITKPTSGLVNPRYLFPVYTNNFVRMALIGFIKEFAAKYDGDPRIAFIEAGLLGTWGEWYPDRGEVKLPDDIKMLVLQTYTENFHKTKIMMRWPQKEYAEISIGYHDDWFADWLSNGSLHSLQTKAGTAALKRWETCPIGARLHPHYAEKDTSYFLKKKEFSQEFFLKLIQRDHITWIRYLPSNNTPAFLIDNLKTLSAKMGYELHIQQAVVRTDTKDMTRQLSVTITNTGIAPFYYPWQAEVGLWRDEKMQQIWPVDWDITKVIPGENSVTYQATLKGLTKKAQVGKILLHVVNPLKKGFAFRFANKTQDADLSGWVTLVDLADN